LINKTTYRAFVIKIVFTTIAFFLFFFGIGYAQECNIVYVTPGGASSGIAGTKNIPASFLYGLSLANSTNDKIYMASGTYIVYNPVNLKSDISIDGGHDDITWEKSNATTTTIYRDNSNMESSPARFVAMYGTNISNFQLHDLTIQSANAFSGGISSYGIRLSGCSNYSIIRCKITSGNGGNGINGSNGVSGIGGAPGTIGQNGDEQGGCCTGAGVGGGIVGSFPGSYAGGNGGNGGDRGTASCTFCGNPQDATNGYIASSGLGPSAGIGGNGGAKIVVCIYPLSCPRTPVNDGQNGVAGTNGLSGISGNDGMGLIAGFHYPTSGTIGTAATHGSGGGGGGGGGSLGGIPYDCLFGLPPNVNGAGAGGGGGGEGGEAGLGGTGGTGGGSSFAFYLYNNGANGLIKDCQITSGNPGLGGLGGFGGTGGSGGLGGIGGGQGNCRVGAGGTGGNGGNGGKGSDGVRFGLYESSFGVPVSLMNINSLQQPFVSVKYGGCTDAPVEFSTSASGTVQWYFGAGSIPSSKIGDTTIAAYITTGRKTFTMVNNGIPYTYSDFINIYSSGAGLNPVIDTITSTNLCVGDVGSFISSITASDYMWFINRNSEWDTISGPSYYSMAYTFDSVGTYNIILKTVHNCCGESFPDTISVTVNPIISPLITIQSSDTSNMVCQGTNLTFSAIAENAVVPVFQWYLNGLPVWINSPTFSTSTLANGDVVSCSVTTTSGCSAGQADTSNSISVTVVEFPNISCSADSFTTSQPTYFIANVDSGGLSPFTYSWDFGDQTMGAGSSVAHIYTSPGVYDIQVNVIDSNGCPGVCNTVVTIFSQLLAGFTASSFNGCAPLSIDFLNQSTNAITYLWEFGDGITSVLENPSYIYTNPGTYDVTLSAFGPTGNDNALITNQVMVLPSPVVNFQAYPQVITNPIDTVFFADNSLDAWTWEWYFGDPLSGNNYSTEQNPWHFYSSNGSYSVSLVITNAYGCTDSITKHDFILVGIDTSSSLGIGENNIISSFLLYPNPSTNNINILLNLAKSGFVEIRLLSITGQEVLKRNFETIIPGTTEVQMEIASLGLSKGLYLIELNYKGNYFYKKIAINSQ